jgi:hypothetical protein
VAVGKPDTHDEIYRNVNVFVGAKAERVLAVNYRQLEETIIEMGECLRSRYHF